MTVGGFDPIFFIMGRMIIICSGFCSMGLKLGFVRWFLLSMIATILELEHIVSEKRNVDDRFRF